MKSLNQVEAGWDAYGSDGQKIGSIYDARQEYLVVEKGLIFPKDIYVPANAVERADAGEQRVYLNVAKDDIESMGWDEPASAGRDTSGETWESRRDASRDRDMEPAGTMATKRTRYGDDDGEHGAEVAGGGVGAVGGAVVGAAVAGPPGALAGGAIGAAAGAMTGEAAEHGHDEAGSGAGGAAGAIGGAVVGGAVAGPPGALAGGAIGGGVGAGAGDKAEEKAEDETDDR
jgi:hypothetical protein